MHRKVIRMVRMPEGFARRSAMRAKTLEVIRRSSAANANEVELHPIHLPSRMPTILQRLTRKAGERCNRPPVTD
jgi:hypothetical protein